MSDEWKIEFVKKIVQKSFEICGFQVFKIEKYWIVKQVEIDSKASNGL